MRLQKAIIYVDGIFIRKLPFNIALVQVAAQYFI